MLVAFYFLLHVGEYTKPQTVCHDGKRVPATRTKLFVVINVGFFLNGVIVPQTLMLDVLLAADLVVLKISNQKNGRMGQTIMKHATSKLMCPVRALAHIVHDMLSEEGNENTLLFPVNTGT